MGIDNSIELSIPTVELSIPPVVPTLMVVVVVVVVTTFHFGGGGGGGGGGGVTTLVGWSPLWWWWWGGHHFGGPSPGASPDIEGSKTNVATDAWLPQINYPVVTFLTRLWPNNSQA